MGTLRARAGEVVGGLASAVLGVILVLYVRTFPELPGGYPGPALFPGILGGLFVLFGVALLVQVATDRVPESGEAGLDPEPWTRAVPNALAFLLAIPAYLVLAPRTGFAIAMGLVMLALFLRLRVHPVLAVVTAVVAPLVISYLFGDLLRVPLPRGPFGR